MSIWFYMFSYLKHPSLFAAWFFWTFQNKSHNMKALFVLSHSWSQFLTLTCLYGEMNFCGARCTLLEYFWEKKVPPDRLFNIGAHITWEGFTEIFLSNIIKYGKSDIEWQTRYEVEWFLGLCEEKRRKL